MISGLRAIGVVFGLLGLGGLVALLNILLAATLSLAKGVAIPDDTKLALLAVGGVDGAAAAFGFLVMYGVFTLRRWARYVLLIVGILALALMLTLSLQRFVIDSDPVDAVAAVALCVFVVLPALLVTISLTPSVKQTMTR